MSREKYVLRLYPRTWRQRYEEEVLAMLEDCPGSWLDSIDLFFGALDAHLHPHLGANSMPLLERMKQMLSLLRGSLLTIFCTYVGFILAYMGFQKLNEYNGFHVAAQTSNLVGFSFNLVALGAFLAFLAILLGGLPIVSSIVQSALIRKRYRSLLLLTVPALAFAVFLGTTFLLEAIFKPGNHIGFIRHILLERGLFLGVLSTGVVISASALCFAVVRSEIPIKYFHFALLPSLLAILSMLLTLIATLIWGLSLQNTAPQFFDSNEGVFASSTPLSWLGIMITMAIAVAIATIAFVRGLSARSALKTTTI